MGLRPTHGDESALLRFIDSKRVTRDFRGSETKHFDSVVCVVALVREENYRFTCTGTRH